MLGASRTAVCGKSRASVIQWAFTTHPSILDSEYKRSIQTFRRGHSVQSPQKRPSTHEWRVPRSFAVTAERGAPPARPSRELHAGAFSKIPEPCSLASGSTVWVGLGHLPSRTPPRVCLSAARLEPSRGQRGLGRGEGGSSEQGGTPVTMWRVRPGNEGRNLRLLPSSKLNFSAAMSAIERQIPSPSFGKSRAQHWRWGTEPTCLHGPAPALWGQRMPVSEPRSQVLAWCLLHDRGWRSAGART